MRLLEEAMSDASSGFSSRKSYSLRRRLGNIENQNMV